MLKSLGWDLVRVWSTDWFDNADLETERLVRKLETLRQRERSPSESVWPLYSEDKLGESTKYDFGREEPEAETTPDEDEGSDDRKLEPAFKRDTAPAGGPLSADGLTIVNGGSGRLTPAEARKVLEAFRESMIRPAQPDWDAARSILRPGMIETLVEKRIIDPDMWYERIPQYLRAGTNPMEKTRYLEEICEIVDRIRPSTASSARKKTESSLGGEPYSAIASPEAARPLMQPTGAAPATYVITDVASVARPNRERFHDPDYTSTLREMVALVVQTEGPILEDLLVERIARAHDLQRSGNQIRRRVVGLLPPGSAVERRVDEVVVWPAGFQPDTPFPYRRDPSGERGHEAVPVEELASLARPFLRLRLDDEAVLRRMADEFDLGRLRASTRERFKVALGIARKFQ
jgi:hypothetical protein